jgi:transcriptional regulator with XRE-family HTH domain
MGGPSPPARHLTDDIGHRIKMLRLRRRLSQKSVAEAIGMDASQLSKIENGSVHDPGFSTVERIVVMGLGAELADVRKGGYD